MATDAEGQSRQGMDIPSLSLFKFVSGIPAVLDLRVLSGSDGSRRVSRRSMKGAEQSYKHQTDEWQCELHRDPFISARALKAKARPNNSGGTASMEEERFGMST
jgi:hypothetical protein